MNASERLVSAELERSGYRVYRNGWPDFLCVHSSTNEVCAVEVKTANDRVSKAQHANFAVLKMVGLYTYVVQPHQNPDFDRCFDGAPAKLEAKASDLILAQEKIIEDLSDDVKALREIARAVLDRDGHCMAQCMVKRARQAFNDSIAAEDRVFDERHAIREKYGSSSARRLGLRSGPP